MSNSSSYLFKLKNEVFNTGHEQMSEAMEYVCYNYFNKLILELQVKSEELNEKANNAEHEKNIQNVNRFSEYVYIKLMRKEITSYNQIIPIIENLRMRLDCLSPKKLNEQEYQTILLAIEKIKNNVYKLKNYSAKRLQRLISGTVPLNLSDIDVLIKAYYIPEATNGLRPKYHSCYLSTKNYIKDLGLKYRNDNYLKILRLACENEPKTSEALSDFLSMILYTLYEIDKNEQEKNDVDERIWQEFSPIINTAIQESQIPKEKIQEIKDEALVDIRRDYKLYSDILGEELTIKDSGFKSNVLYRFYNMMLKKSEKEMDEIWAIVCNKVYRKSIEMTQNLLHPNCEIKAPCYINGSHIFIGASCSVDENCFLKSNVVVLGPSEGVNENEKTIIGKGVIIKERSIILSGSNIGDNCIIENDLTISGQKKFRCHISIDGRETSMNEEHYLTLFNDYKQQIN